MFLPAPQTYHYNLDTGACHDPLRLRYSHHVRYPVDLGAMQAAARLLVGTHDFTQLSNDSVERLRRNPVKTLQRFDVVQVGPAHVRLEVRVLCVLRRYGLLCSWRNRFVCGPGGCDLRRCGKQLAAVHAWF